MARKLDIDKLKEDLEAVRSQPELSPQRQQEISTSLGLDKPPRQRTALELAQENNRRARAQVMGTLGTTLPSLITGNIPGIAAGLGVSSLFPNVTEEEGILEAESGLAEMISGMIPGRGLGRAALRVAGGGGLTGLMEAARGQDPTAGFLVGGLSSIGGEAPVAGLRKSIERGSKPDQKIFERVKKIAGKDKEFFGLAAERGVGRGTAFLLNDLFLGRTRAKFSSDRRLNELTFDALNRLRFIGEPSITRSLARVPGERTIEDVLDSAQRRIEGRIDPDDFFAKDKITGKIFPDPTVLPKGAEFEKFTERELTQLTNALHVDPGKFARQIGPDGDNIPLVDAIRKGFSEKDRKILASNFISQHLLGPALDEAEIGVDTLKRFGIANRISDEALVVRADTYNSALRAINEQKLVSVIGEDAARALKDIGIVLKRNEVDLTKQTRVGRSIAYLFNKITFSAAFGGAAAFAATGFAQGLAGLSVAFGLGALVEHVLVNPKAGKLLLEASEGKGQAAQAFFRGLLANENLLPIKNEVGQIEFVEKDVSNIKPDPSRRISPDVRDINNLFPPGQLERGF